MDKVGSSQLVLKFISTISNFTSDAIVHNGVSESAARAARARARCALY